MDFQAVKVPLERLEQLERQDFQDQVDSLVLKDLKVPLD
jgi:hypothetical protein